MPRRQIDPVQRIVNDYASLSSAERSLVSAAIKGYEIGSGNTGTVARRAPVTPRAKVVPVTKASDTGSYSDHN